MSYPEATLAKNGEVVAITGSSAGLGRAIAQQFAKHGAKLGSIARGRERLDQAVLEMNRLGSHAVAISADVADASQVEKAAQEIERVLGPIDV